MNIAINGFGRIGRQVFRILMQRGAKVVAINDLTDTETLAHLLEFDSNYGKYPGSVGFDDSSIIVDGHKVVALAEKDPAKLPWKNLAVDLVVESTGFFTDGNKARAHITAGAKKVIITGPSENYDFSVILGNNQNDYDSSSHDIITNAS